MNATHYMASRVGSRLGAISHAGELGAQANTALYYVYAFHDDRLPERGSDRQDRGIHFRISARLY